MQFCFYFGYKNNIGGYATLLICLMRELVRKKEKVVLFNYPDGLIARELSKELSKIKLLNISTIDWSKIDDHIQSEDVFIINRFEECFQNLFKINPKIIYYDINDFIGSISRYKFGLNFSLLGRKLIKNLLETKSLIFMDDTGIFNLEKQFSIKPENPIFLPIPVNTINENYYLDQKLFLPNTLCLTYVGRSVKWKMMPLKKILYDCSKLNFPQSIKISIVVDSINDFEKLINVNDYKKNSKLVIEVFENLAPSKINDFLIEKSQLHFGMGTASLDAAKLGIPTILVDSSIHEFNIDYSYRWLFETKHFSLGINLDKRQQEKGMKMEEIINKIFSSQKNSEEISKKSFEYVQKNHSAMEVTKKLIEICKNSEFRIKDARHYIIYYFKFHSIIKNVFNKFNVLSKKMQKRAAV